MSDPPCSPKLVRREFLRSAAAARALPLAAVAHGDIALHDLAHGVLVTSNIAHGPHSQLMGGMIWGMSAGLLEATELDERVARTVNRDRRRATPSAHSSCTLTGTVG